MHGRRRFIWMRRAQLVEGALFSRNWYELPCTARRPGKRTAWKLRQLGFLSILRCFSPKLHGSNYMISVTEISSFGRFRWFWVLQLLDQSECLQTQNNNQMYTVGTSEDKERSLWSFSLQNNKVLTPLEPLQNRNLNWAIFERSRGEENKRQFVSHNKG